MALIKHALMLTLVVTLAGCGPGESNTDEKNYKGISVNSEWDNKSVCQTTRMIIRENFSKQQSDSLYSTTCTVSKLTAHLPGKLSIYDPYAVSWPNGIAARIFVTGKGLKVSGVSKHGIPFSWNNNHKPISKSESGYIQECSELFTNKVNAKNIKIVSVKKYDDLSGANVELKYTNENQIETEGSCLFDRTKMTMASSKIESDKYSKRVH